MNPIMLDFILNEEDREQIENIQLEFLRKKNIPQAQELNDDFFKEQLNYYFDEVKLIYENAHKRSLRYYTEHFDELLLSLKREIKSYAAFFVSSFEADIKTGEIMRQLSSKGVENYKRIMDKEIALYLEILKNNAPKDYEEIIGFIDYAFEHRMEFFKEEREAIKHGKKKAIMPKMPSNLAGFFPMATGAAIFAMQEMLTAGGREGIENLPELKKRINHSTKYKISEGDPAKQEESGLTIMRKDWNNRRRKNYIRVGLPDNVIDKKLGYGINAKKLLLFCLQKINQQILKNGEVTREFITFPLQELIEKGFYTSQRSAQTGFKIAASIMTSIRIEGEIGFSDRKPAKHIFQLSVLFPTTKYADGQYQVFVNQQVDWSFIFQAFSILPEYYYELSNKSSELLFYIFSIARQHTEDIKERGYFTLSCRALQLAMHLPEEKKTEHPDRDIKQAILNAIDEVDAMQNKYFHDEDLLFLSLEYKEEWNIAQFLNEGYLYVGLSGSFATPFIKVEEDKIKGIKEAQRKKQKALEAKNKKEN